MQAASARFQSARVAEFQESVIREQTRLAITHGAVNLAQGLPDFPAPQPIKRAAQQAIADDINQYAITWGAKDFRAAIADYYERFYSFPIDPEHEITVCCGATEGMIAALLALLNPGDEVVLFEPFYENYWPDSQLSGAVCRHVRLSPPDWALDTDELRRAFTARTKAVVLNTPNNPTGRVFSRAELESICALCREFDTLLITDEIYEHIVFDGRSHVLAASLPDMRGRSVIVNSLSKTFSVTGWRVGWVIAPPELTGPIRKVHDFLTVGAPAPLQRAGITALTLPDMYFAELCASYQDKRDVLLPVLADAGLRCSTPEGAYYILANIDQTGFRDDLTFCRHLVTEVGVAAVPGSSFYSRPEDGAHWVRFCFAKKRQTLAEAAERLLAKPLTG